MSVRAGGRYAGIVAFELPPNLHPNCGPVAWLLGSWIGNGHAADVIVLFALDSESVSSLWLGCATNSKIEFSLLPKVDDFCSISMIRSGLLFRSNGMRTTTTTSESSEYSSPVKKLAVFFEKARDRWKAKYIAKRNQAILLANQVRAVEKSREHWKSVAQEAKRELIEMKQAQNNL